MVEANESKWKHMAESNTILRVLVGSEAYGLNIGASSDRDEKGVCIEPMEVFTAFSEFEQYEFRSAAVREGKHDAPSQDGDLDLTIYGLRKFLRLALQGNPSVIELLYIKDHLKGSNVLGVNLQALAPHIISKNCGKRFLGYMESQRQRLLGERGQKKVNRPELEEAHGYDTKYAMHILRLGMQGVELLSTGKLSIPFTGGNQRYLLEVRQGRQPLQGVLTTAGDLERELKDLLDTSPLDDRPNTAHVEAWMIKTYWEWWKSQRVIEDRLQLLP